MLFGDAHDARFQDDPRTAEMPRQSYSTADPRQRSSSIARVRGRQIALTGPRNLEDAAHAHRRQIDRKFPQLRLELVPGHDTRPRAEP